MREAQPNPKVYEAIEKRLLRLYDIAPKSMQDPVSGQFSGGSEGNTREWRYTKALYVGITGEDEDEMLVKEENWLRIATRYSGSWAGGRDYFIRDRYRQTIPLVSLSTIEGREPKLTLNASFPSSKAARPNVPYLPAAQMGHDIPTSLNGQPARHDDVVGLFMSYTGAVKAILEGATVAQAFDGLVLPEHKLASAAEFHPDYTVLTGRWTD